MKERISLDLSEERETCTAIHDHSCYSMPAPQSLYTPCPLCTRNLGRGMGQGFPLAKCYYHDAQGPTGHLSMQAIFQCSYSLNRVQGWACRRPGAISVVLQEVNHCLSDCPQLPVRSYTRKPGSWLWLQVPVLKQLSQAQSPRTVKAAALSIQPWVHCCSLTAYILVNNRCTQWETTQLRADDRLQDTRQRDKSHTHGVRGGRVYQLTPHTLLTQANDS